MAVSSERLIGDLAALGVAEGGVLMVHASLSAIGRVEGGAETVVDGLLAALGPAGTLVMPAFRASVCRPGLHRRLPEPVLAEARRRTPPHDPATTPSEMGAITEAFRRRPGVRRSPHPTDSITAFGPAAEALTATHPLPWSTGATSPFGRLDAMDAQFLLLGVGFNRLTLLHYAEGLVPHGRRKTRVVPIDGACVLAEDVGDDIDTHFPEIGRLFLAEGRARQGHVGEAASVLMRAGAIVPFATDYLTAVLGPA
ncbi:MAG: AAC(3) family N-acetyltransferase [Pseudomonadota bacterium]